MRNSVNEVTHRKRVEDLGILKKSVSGVESCLGRRRLAFASSRRPLWRVPNVLGWSRWKKQNRKNVYLFHKCINAMGNFKQTRPGFEHGSLLVLPMTVIITVRPPPKWYIHKPKSVLENGMHKILRNFEIQRILVRPFFIQSKKQKVQRYINTWTLPDR